MEHVTIDDITLSLAGPVELPLRWVGQEELLRQLLAAWMVIDERDIPFNPRLIGKPGVGKTTLAYAAAKRLNRRVYLFQATMDTRPEDLIVTPVIGPDGKIQYAASSLVSAMLKGGVVIIDEGNRMSEKAWASLAPLLDDRRYVESIITGLRIPAHRDFRIVVTMNEDASTFEVPEYIHSRLQPQIYIDFPEAEEELPDPQGKPPLCREQDPQVRGRLSPARPCRRRALLGAGRDQHRPLRPEDDACHGEGAGGTAAAGGGEDTGGRSAAGI